MTIVLSICLFLDLNQSFTTYKNNSKFQDFNGFQVLWQPCTVVMVANRYKLPKTY